MRGRVAGGWVIRVGGVVALLAAGAGAHGQTCVPEWSDVFRAAGIPLGAVRCATMHDDGTGPALYIGGDFATVEGRFVGGVVKWDGVRLSPVGQGVGFVLGSAGQVRALASVDFDGPGGAPASIVVGGSFFNAFNTDGTEVPSPSLARWAGGQWQPMGADFTSDIEAIPGVATLIVANAENTGPRLYIGGGFPGRVAWTSDLVNFDGLSPGQFDWGVAAITPFDADGPGPLPTRIFFGGGFNGGLVELSGGVPSFVPGTINGDIRALAVFDNDGPGPALPKLYVGWPTIRTWNAVDGWGVFSAAPENQTFDVLTVANLGAGPRLFIGGEYAAVPPVGQPEEPYSRVVQWDGTTLSPLGSGLQLPNNADGGADAVRRVFTLVPCTLRGQPALFVGGDGFTGAGGRPARNMAFWGGSQWLPQYDGPAHGVPASSWGTFSLDTDGPGPTPARLLTLTGPSTAAGDAFYPGGIAQWTPAGWQTPSPPLSAPPGFGPVSFITYDDGTGPALFAYGSTTGAPGDPLLPRLAKLVGGAWQVIPHAFGGGLFAAAAVFDLDGPGGNGPVLVLGGNSSNTSLPGTFPNIIAYNGSSWVGVAGGFPDVPPVPGVSSGTDLSVLGLAVHQGNLYASGLLSPPFTSPKNIVARLTGATWTPIASHTGTFGSSVRAGLATADVGSGQQLYLIGTLPYAVNGVQIDGIGRWNGSTFEPLGGGVLLNAAASTGTVNAIAAFNDGSGTQLYVSGGFDAAGGQPAGGLARWNGSTWSAVPGVTSGGRLVVHDDDGAGPSRPALYVWGDVLAPDSDFSAGIGRWGCPPVACIADFNGAGGVTVQDIFDYLSAYFAGDLRADVNSSGSLTVQDIFDFLTAYFAGC